MFQFALASILLALPALSQADSPNPAVELTPDTYPGFLAANPSTLVWLADPNDIALDLQLRDVATTALEKAWPVALAWIDFRKYRGFLSAAEPLAVSPGFLLRHEGQTHLFDGSERKSDLLGWLNTQLFSVDALQLISLEQIRKVSKLRFAILLILEPSNTDQMREFLASVRSDPAARYYFTYLTESRALFTNATSRTTINVIRDFEDGHKTLASDDLILEERIREFAGMFRRPAVHTFDRRFVDSAFTENVTALVWLRPHHWSLFFNNFSMFAWQNRHLIDHYSCVLEDDLCKTFGAILGHFDEASDGLFVVQNNAEGFSKFKLRAPLTSENLGQFLRDFRDGLLSQFVKSEPEPRPTQEEGVLQKVVRSTANKLVFKPNKDVVLFVFSERSQDWRSAQGVIEQVALSYMGDNSVTFLRYDFSLNEHDRIYVPKVPGLLVFQRSNKNQPKVFQGAFERSEVLEFLFAVLERKETTQAAMAEVEVHGEF